MQNLISIINEIYPISKELIEFLPTVLKREEYPKGGFPLKAGQVLNRVIFVEKGLLRSFVIEDERENTLGFYPEGKIPISHQSFEDLAASIESVEALEDTTIVSLLYKDLQHILKTYPEANVIGRLVFGRARNRTTDQLNKIKTQSAGRRYDWFVNHFPDLVQRVPGKYIASFLGMTEYTLSRVRGQM